MTIEEAKITPGSMVWIGFIQSVEAEKEDPSPMPVKLVGIENGIATVSTYFGEASYTVPLEKIFATYGECRREYPPMNFD